VVGHPSDSVAYGSLVDVEVLYLGHFKITLHYNIIQYSYIVVTAVNFTSGRLCEYDVYLLT